MLPVRINQQMLLVEVARWEEVVEYKVNQLHFTSPDGRGRHPVHIRYLGSILGFRYMHAVSHRQASAGCV